MQKVITFVSTWWPVLAPIATWLLVNVANAVSNHYSTATGVKKALLFVAEILSITKSRDAAGMIKPLFVSAPPPPAVIPMPPPEVQP